MGFSGGAQTRYKKYPCKGSCKRNSYETICGNIVSRYQTLVPSLPWETTFWHRRPKAHFMTGCTGSPVNRKEIEPKGIPSWFIPSLLVVLFTRQLEILVTSQILLPYTWLSSQNPWALPVFLIYNCQQNELRHFPLKGLFEVFLTSKGEK